MADARSLCSMPTEPPSAWRPAVRAVPPAPRVMSVGGGKGGIGKSLVAANLAIALARRGERVLLVDADLAGASLHTCLGLDLPKRGLADVLGRRAELREVAVPTGVENLALVAGAMDHPDAADPKLSQKARLTRQLRAADADRVIIDLGAGTHLHTLDLFLVAEHGVLVLVPEPSAVENAYRFLKAAFWRHVRHAVSAQGCEGQLRAVIGEGTFKSPAEILAALAARHPPSGAVLARELEAFRPRLVVNQARTPQDDGVGQAVVEAWRKFFGLRLDYLGQVPHDGELWYAMRARRPLLVHAPEAPSARSFTRMADGLAALEAAEVHRRRTT